MTVKILHLYGGIMNLYGEYANVSALERYLGFQGADVEIIKADTASGIELSEFDLVYIGSGTEHAQMRAMSDITENRENVLKALDGKTVFLATGNSFEIFGKSITDAEGRSTQGLGVCDFETELRNTARDLCDSVFKADFLDDPCVGFINKASTCKGVKAPMMRVVHGIGNSKNDCCDGVMSGRLYGTHLIGPVLVKNPHLAKYFVKLLVEGKGGAFLDFETKYETASFESTLALLAERFSK